MDAITEEHEDGGTLEHLVPAIRQVRMAIHKSSLLYRMLYCGQPLRTKKCPVHEGRWSGIPGFNDGDMCACELTGWLPEDQ